MSDSEPADKRRTAKIGSRATRKMSDGNYGSVEVSKWCEIEVSFENTLELSEKSRRLDQWVLEELMSEIKSAKEVLK